MAGEELIGVLNLGCGKARAFTDNDIKLLTIVADQLALSIERVNYQQRVKSISFDLQQVREQLQRAQTKRPATDRWGEIAPLVAAINHGINNALSVIVGNIQCLLWEKAAVNQKSLSRLRRMEGAALQISTLNHKVLELKALVQSSSASTQGGKEINLTGVPRESM
jgi:GAF domain-containing protein